LLPGIGRVGVVVAAGFGLGEDDGRMACEGAKGKEGIEREREVIAARRAQQTERHGL
jgi:hypothetical protein